MNVLDVAVQDTDDLDLNYLYRWTDMHGTAALLKELLANTPRL